MTSYVHTINPIIAAEIGEAESILLNQIDYWISKCGKKIAALDGIWIYNSYKNWAEQFTYWSLSKLRRTIKSLENQGLIKSSKINSKKWNQTKWYTIDYNKYNQLLNSKTLKLAHDKTIKKENTNSNLKLVNKLDGQISYHESNSQKSPELCICSKWTNQTVQNEQMIYTKNNYTKNIISFNDLKGKKNIKLKKEETDLIYKMIDIWNKVFDYSVF